MAVFQVVGQFLSRDLGAGEISTWSRRHFLWDTRQTAEQTKRKSVQANKNKQTKKNTEKKQQKAKGEVGEVGKQLRPS